MAASVLHISDLHRDLTNEMGNGPLLESLALDIARYGEGNPPIATPQICVVSGDLVYGVKPGTPNGIDELRRQYAQALDFLASIADRFFAGDRERVVIVPGNHDVCYEDVLAACHKIPIPADADERKGLINELFRPKTMLRWSWADCCFHRIIDGHRYAARLSLFAEAYNRFYNGSRTFSVAPERQFDIFEYPALEFTVVGLSSCHDNDPMRRAGAFHPDCVAEITRQLQGPAHSGRLIAAVWHHSVLGVPGQDDYLDAAALLHLIDAGVSLGFHGHQHRTDYVQERYRIGGNRRKLLAVSAGTLCAGPGALAPGETRSYNVVEVDVGKQRCCVHQRRMQNNDFAFPIWSQGGFTETGRSFIEIDIDGPVKRRAPNLDSALVIERAEQLIGESRWTEAVEILRECDPDSVARPLLGKALFELGDPQTTITVLWPPRSPAEIVQIGDSILEGGTLQQATDFLALDVVSKGRDASIAEVGRRVKEWSTR